MLYTPSHTSLLPSLFPLCVSFSHQEPGNERVRVVLRVQQRHEAVLRPESVARPRGGGSGVRPALPRGGERATSTPLRHLLLLLLLLLLSALLLLLRDNEVPSLELVLILRQDARAALALSTFPPLVSFLLPSRARRGKGGAMLFISIPTVPLALPLIFLLLLFLLLLHVVAVAVRSFCRR